MGKKSQIEERVLSIKVSKEVVSRLSLGLYKNLARAVKELVSNSYDAGALEVKIKLDLENARIIVRDNGRGMDITELDSKFLNIGLPAPLTEKVDELGRKRVGTFGIGWLAVFPYCDMMRVITKKRGANQIIEASINTAQFFKEGTFLIEEAKVPCKISPSDLPKEKGETIIVLENIKPHIARELRQGKSSVKSIERLGGFQKFKWTLSQYCPIQFPPDRKDLREFFEDSKRVPMRLWLDGEELFRNVPKNTKILEKGAEKFGCISLKYAIMSALEPIKPDEARGLQIRLRDVGIGLPSDFDVMKLKRVLGKLNWICGEISILRGLSSALMVDRDSFSYTQEVADIYEFFRKKLVKWNENLERWAAEDKQLYAALGESEESNKMVNELKSAGVIHISKERLRLRKTPIVESKAIDLSTPAKKLAKALYRKKGYRIIFKKGKVLKRETPIKVIPEKKSILVYEDHPSFVETIKVAGKEFRVDYDTWNPKETPYSICKLQDTEKVTFNTAHPLFKTKLSNEIIKRLSLGILLILKESEDKEELLGKINQLLGDVFGE